MKVTGKHRILNICRSIFQHLVIWALVFMLLFDGGISHLLFRHLQEGARQEIMEMIEKGLSKDELVLIIEPEQGLNGLSWIKPGREFSYKGEMYDVVKTETHHQSKYYFCLDDSREKQLITNYNKSSREKEKAKRYRWSFTLLFFPPEFSLNTENPVTDLLFATLSCCFDSNFTEILTPPPREGHFT